MLLFYFVFARCSNVSRNQLSHIDRSAAKEQAKAKAATKDTKVTACCIV